MWGLSSTMISYQRNSILPQEAEMNSPKTVCGCPCGGVMKTVTRTVLLPWDLHLSAYSCICWGTPRVFKSILGNVATTTVQFKMVVLRLEKPICAAPRLSEVFPTLPLKRFQCFSDWWWLPECSAGECCNNSSSVQDGSFALGKAHIVSQKFPQRCLWNGSNACRIDDGPHHSSFQGRLSIASYFHASLLQVINGVMSLALCP